MTKNLSLSFSLFEKGEARVPADTGTDRETRAIPVG